MTPDEQVKEIVRMLNPENPSSADAVFLVQNYMNKALESLSAKDKQIALLEAELEAERGKTSLITNEKLQAESKLKDEIKKMRDDGVVVTRLDRRPGVGGGQTL